MIIEINDKYRIQVTTYHHALQENTPPHEHPKKKGVMTTDRWDDLGYYPSIRQCLNFLIQKGLCSMEETVTLQEYYNKLEGLFNEYGSKYV